MAIADLGTSKVALTVARVTGENTEVLYYRESPSEGVRYGSIFNPMKAAECLRKSVANAENELGIKILQLVTNMPRSSVRQESSPAQIQRSDPGSCITEEEVNALKNITLDNYPLDDPDHEEIYGAVPQSFSADDMIRASESDVIGVCSDYLKGNFRIFVGSKKPVDNIYKMTNTLNLAIARKVFSPEAVGRAVLNEGEMENGVGLIEIGAGVSSVSIFQDGILRYYASIPFGGGNVTNDIKMECNIKGVLAENIKLAFGACQPDKLQTMSEKLLLISNEEIGTTQKLPVKYLSEIITSRMHEIIQALLFLIQDSTYADKLRAGLVVTGGGASLVNCVNLIKEESGYNVRIGYPNTRSFSLTECPGFGELGSAASVGMLLIAREDQRMNCLSEDIKLKGTAATEEKEEQAAEQQTESAAVEEPRPVKKKARESGDPELFSRQEQKREEEKEEEKPRILVEWGQKLRSAWDKSVFGKYYEEMQ